MNIVALSRALTDPIEGMVDLSQYDVTGRDCWQQPGPGWRFEVEYFDLVTPIPKKAVIDELYSLNIEDGPIVRGGRVRQGYFTRLSLTETRATPAASLCS
jgi:hypothetical protein